MPWLHIFDWLLLLLLYKYSAFHQPLSDQHYNTKNNHEQVQKCLKNVLISDIIILVRRQGQTAGNGTTSGALPK